MVRFGMILGGCLFLAACDTDQYTRPIDFKPHGEAVRANMAAQIIDPNPPAPRPALTDANRPASAIDAYRKDEVKEPNREDAAASTASVNN